MKVLKFIYLTFAQAYYRWAMRERLTGTHPDLPAAVLRLRELEDQSRRLFSV
jgi:hypothetical protein